MIYRSYIKKDTTIVSDSQINLGGNPMNRLFFSGEMGNERFSRVLMSFDINPLIEKYENCELGDLSNVKHELVVYPTRFYDDNDSEDCQATSFELCLFKIRQNWVQGCGYDYQCEDCGSIGFASQYVNENCQGSKGAANWYDAIEGQPWEQDGVIDTSLYLSPAEYQQAIDIAIENVSTGTFIYESGSVYLPSGTTFDDLLEYDYYTGSPYMQCVTYSCNDKVIRFDVTEDVNNHLISGSPHYGYGFAFSRFYEDNPAGVTKVLGFYSKETNGYFKPFLETNLTTALRDNRSNFYENVDNNLYMYVNINGNPANLDRNPIVNIYDTEEELYGSFTGSCVSKGVYGINLSIAQTGDVVCGLWEDIWSDIYFNGRRLDDVQMEFELKPNDNYYKLGYESNDSKEYQFQMYGIENLEYVRIGEKRKVIINPYEKYKSKKKTAVDNIQYRLYIKEGRQQYDIIPWSDVNMGVCDNYIFIDTTWMLPQAYYLDFKVINNGEETLYPSEIKFIVLENLENKK